MYQFLIQLISGGKRLNSESRSQHGDLSGMVGVVLGDGCNEPGGWPGFVAEAHPISAQLRL